LPDLDASEAIAEDLSLKVDEELAKALNQKLLEAYKTLNLEDDERIEDYIEVAISYSFLHLPIRFKRRSAEGVSAGGVAEGLYYQGISNAENAVKAENPASTAGGTAKANLAKCWSAAFSAGQRFKVHRRELPDAPKGFKNLENHPLKSEFFGAMDKHLKNHAAKRSWDAVRKKKAIGHQVLDCIWVFTYKTDKHGMLQNCKARLVVYGNQQKPGDLLTRATTLAATSFRTLMTIAAKFDLETIQLNAINAFMNAELDELVYMCTPPGFPIRDHVLRLNRAFYGLRRSPLLWQKELSKAPFAHDFQAVPQEPCILIKGSVIAFYFIDDIVFCYRKFAKSEAYAAIEALKKSFKITELEETKWFLGLHVIRDRYKRLL
jgi:hypothetical protein